MHARKLATDVSQETPRLPKATPRILNDDEAVPTLHRTMIESALGRVEVALQELDAVLRTYNPRDPRVYELRTQVATRWQMTLIIGDQWLTWHPAEPVRG